MAPIGKVTAVNWPDLLGRALGVPIGTVKEKRIGSLWAGYGHVSSLTASLPAQPSHQSAHAQDSIMSRLIDAAYAPNASSKSPTLSLIVKQVSPPRGAGASHDRKVRSYEVEAEFYRNHAAALLKPHGHETEGLALPVPLYVTSQPPHAFTFVLSDLSQNFPVSMGSMDMEQLEVALTWLAQLHAHFWEVPSEQLSGLWLPQGSYWHLDTRQEELNQIGQEWSGLKAVAQRLDLLLKGMQPDGGFSERNMTVCHGDFKSANILFSRDKKRCAAFDFQYIGRSFGTRDIVYLLCSSGDDEMLDEPGSEERLLRHYHNKLMYFLAQRQASSTTSSTGQRPDGVLGVDYTFDVLQKHFEWALLDYVRFMAGWGMWGAASWASRRAKELLRKGV